MLDTTSRTTGQLERKESMLGNLVQKAANTAETLQKKPALQESSWPGTECLSASFWRPERYL